MNITDCWTNQILNLLIKRKYSIDMTRTLGCIFCGLVIQHTLSRAVDDFECEIKRRIKKYSTILRCTSVVLFKIQKMYLPKVVPKIILPIKMAL